LGLEHAQETSVTQLRSDYPLDHTQSTTDKSKHRTNGLTDAATDRVKEAAERAQEIASNVAEQARVYGQRAQDAASQVKPYVEKSMKEQPMATLAVASVIGFVLGALWKK
jgi:ElaB/YqjD/DUF883 family membrane-anchored ribosome-binding protein